MAQQLSQVLAQLPMAKAVEIRAEHDQGGDPFPAATIHLVGLRRSLVRCWTRTPHPQPFSRAPSWSPQSWVRSWGHPKETGRQLNFVGHYYSPTPAALFRLLAGPKRRARPNPALAPTSDAPAVSGPGRLRRLPKTPEDAGFLACTAFAARRPIGGLARQGLARVNAAALTRTPAVPALRPTSAGAMPGIGAGRRMIPGPAGRLLRPGGGAPNATRWTKPFV